MTGKLALFALFVLLSALDAATTLRFLRRGHEEGNPLVRGALGRWGPRGLVAVKVAAVVVVGALLPLYDPWVLIVLDTAYAAALVWNLAAPQTEPPAPAGGPPVP